MDVEAAIVNNDVLAELFDEIFNPYDSWRHGFKMNCVVFVYKNLRISMYFQLMKIILAQRGFCMA